MKSYLHIETGAIVTHDDLLNMDNTVYPANTEVFDGYAEIVNTSKPSHNVDTETAIRDSYRVIDGKAVLQWRVIPKPAESIEKIKKQRFLKAKLELSDRINKEARAFGYSDYAMFMQSHSKASDKNALQSKLNNAMVNIDTAFNSAQSDKLPDVQSIVNEALGITEQMP